MSCKKEDHPRACGEKKLDIIPNLCVVGSPPRMRGKDAGGCSFSQRVGITPAYAGKS